MSKRIDVIKLKRYVGLSIINVCIVLFNFEDESDPISVNIQFSNGVELVFCCSGEGKICIRTSSKFKLPDDCRRVCLNVMSGELLKSVHEIENQLVLQTGNHEVRMVNDDDELDLYLDGHQIQCDLI